MKSDSSYMDPEKDLTLGEIYKELEKTYSSTTSSKYVGNATVKQTDSTGNVKGINLNQSMINLYWNMNNPDKEIGGTCAIIANTMMIMNYQDQNKADKDKNADRWYTIFEAQVEYAWNRKIFTIADNKGITASEQVTLATYYLAKKNSKYKAFSNSSSIWDRVNKQLSGNVPVSVSARCTGKVNHAMMATKSYILNVQYKEKNLFGIPKNKNKNYKVLRVCNGWESTNNDRWEETTNSYIYFDCVYEIVYFF